VKAAVIDVGGGSATNALATLNSLDTSTLMTKVTTAKENVVVDVPKAPPPPPPQPAPPPPPQPVPTPPPQSALPPPAPVIDSGGLVRRPIAAALIAVAAAQLIW
jgi:outer membrane biosynthesis protein TonB